MEATGPSQTSGPSVQPPRHPRALKWILSVMLLGMVVLGVVLFWPEPGGPAFAWISPTPIQTWKGRRIIYQIRKFKYSVLQLIGPMGRHFAVQEMQTIPIGVSIFSADRGLIELPERPAMATNVDGSRAWVLSADQLARLRRSRPLDPLNGPFNHTVRTYDGTGLIWTFYDNTVIEMFPRAARQSIRLRFAARIKGGAPNQSNPLVAAGGRGGTAFAVPAFPDVSTNLAFSFEAVIPNQGAVLISTGSARNGTNLWLLISTSGSNAPVKPR